MVTDEEGRTVGPAASGGAMIAPGGAPQGPAALTGMMTGRSTFGGNKRRRKTSTGHAMSEAQEGKVTTFILCECVFFLRQFESTLGLLEPISHTVALPLKSGLSTGRETLNKSKPLMLKKKFAKNQMQLFDKVETHFITITVICK